MNGVLLRSLFKLSFLFLSLYTLGQRDIVTKTSGPSSNDPKPNAHLASFIKIAADSNLQGNGIKKFLIGNNYRKEWLEPVEVPVLNFDASGLVPKKLGGGKETISLRVEDNTGREWALRSVKKFPENAIPPEIRNTIAAKLMEDGISACYPYGALSMGVLSKACNVPFLKNTLVYVPDSRSLGEFRPKFKNILVLMEEQEPSGITQENDKKKEKGLNTQELIFELSDNNNNKVDQHLVLRARLLDNFVMDFDRHEKQWDWFSNESASGKIYYPVPKDRDQVFYSGQGLLSKIISGKNVLPELQGFRKKAKDIVTFNRPVQNFDRFFLTGLSEDDWSREIEGLINSMTDPVIESALQKQPAEIQKYSTGKIISTLKEKRQYFKEEMMRYYRFLAKTVSIVGSNQREQFSISKKDNGEVSVIVNTIDSAGNSSSKIYERSFDPSITKEIRIYGLEDDDRFIVEGGSSPITVRLIGGPGNDEFINKGNARRVLAYDVSFEENIFSGQPIRKRISADPQNNNYTRLGYRYDIHSPGISLEYSIDGGLFIGPKYKIVKQGFRKEPYSMSHVFAANRALNSSSYHIKYNADLIKLFGNTDLLFRGDAKLPTVRTRFFGIGNNSVYDKTKPGAHKYYFARYDLVTISMMARNIFNSWFQIKGGPVFQYFKLRSKENENRYVSVVYPDAGNSKIQYAGKSFAGAELGFAINTKNDQLIPTRGVDVNIYGRSLAGLNHLSNSVTQAGGDLSLFTDFVSKKHVVLATSFGVSHITGVYELEQAQYLGYKQNLRGFRIDRFAGRSRVYNNSEIRFIKNDVNLVLFRGSIGLLVFNDIGRVWADNERSSEWHDGYGWGFWISPLKRFLVAATLMYSKEEKNLVLVNFGFQF